MVNMNKDQEATLRMIVRNAWGFCGNIFQAASDYCQKEGIRFTGAIWAIVDDELGRLQKRGD